MNPLPVRVPLPSTNPTLRLRVFAGPNGSGITTIINAVKAYRVSNIPVDFGIYVNADDIAEALLHDTCSFAAYEVQVLKEEFIQTAKASGLINSDFPEPVFSSSFELSQNKITLLPKQDKDTRERLAQVLADFLRKKLLKEKKKFSFETVFSHPSKLDIMRQAAAAGYKVYLYFVSTESPEINIYRVEVRKAKGGHDVESGKIRSRYKRSLDLLYEAAQIAYRAFFFDNSNDAAQQDTFEPFAHFKVVKGKKEWDELNESEVPDWFIKYYHNKVIENLK